MITQIVVEILAIVMLVCIIILKMRLTKLTAFIGSLVSRLSGIEKNRNLEEMMSFLQEVQRSPSSGAILPDKLLEKDTIDFIFEDTREMRIYIHYTKNEADAEKILKDGFKFVDSFYKTAMPVSRDDLDLKIKHNNRKLFGNYLVILSISSDIVNFYTMELDKAGIRNFSFENILTEELPYRNENSDLIYKLSPHFVKGYLNYMTGEIIKNLSFDPWYVSLNFQKNIELLKANNIK